ncbi:MAG: beta-lactamase domain protein [Solirubrobacterales bacterium]|jgi:glyoxylase-like metal-dependent hydrolase (beta-lactamase superfamily II)|nr:beta-lactamase domain protein [Solirubrobacterales bacterium]
MRLIDLNHLGREQVIGSWLVGDVLIDPGPSSCLDALLEGLDGEVPKVIALTHIHLDHAGATGTLAQRWPEAEIWVHERGARHLAEPQKLLASAARLYGDDMDRLWGEFLPVPKDRIRAFAEPSRIGDFRFAPTPGHASHHLSYLHEPTGSAFTGDTAGARIAGSPTIGPTPPPDIDIDAWLTSLELIESWSPDRLMPTHFGSFDDVAAQLDELRLWFDTWVSAASRLDLRTWVREHHEWVAARSTEAIAAALGQAVPTDQAYLGLERYWSLQEPA